MFLHIDNIVVPMPFAKKLSLLCQHLCIKSVDHMYVGLFLESLFCFMDLCLFLFHYHTVLVFIALELSPEIK